MSTLFSRIKYMNRPEYNFKAESDLFKLACHWIGQDVPGNTYFQVRLMFSNLGIANQCYCEVFQDGVSLGSIKMLSKHIKSPKGGVRFFGEALMKQTTTQKGYKNIQFNHKGSYKSFRVHRLVAQSFVPNPENKATAYPMPHGFGHGSYPWLLVNP